MVIVKSDVTFQGYEQRQIKSGERAGQSYYVVKVMSGFDTLELMIFNDNGDLLGKILKATPFQKYTAELGITQNSGNTRISLVDLNAVSK